MLIFSLTCHVSVIFFLNKKGSATNNSISNQLLKFHEKCCLLHIFNNIFDVKNLVITAKVNWYWYRLLKLTSGRKRSFALELNAIEYSFQICIR